MAADELADLQQEERVPQHNAAFMRLHDVAGELLNLETDSKLVINRYRDSLADDMHPDVQHHSTETMRSEIEDLLEQGKLPRLKHVMRKAEQLDKVFHKRATKARLVGAQYWNLAAGSASKSSSKRSRQAAPISQVSDASMDEDSAEINQVSEELERMLRLEQKVQNVETSQHKFQTDTASLLKAMKNDTDKRFLIVEKKADTTHDLCGKIWDQVSKGGLPQQPANVIVSQPMQPIQTQAPIGWQQQAQPMNQQGWGNQQQQLMPQHQFSGSVFTPPSKFIAPYRGLGGAMSRQPLFRQMGGKGGKGGRNCYACGQPGHIARLCPFLNKDSPQYMGSARVSAIARDMRAATNNYYNGGVNALSSWDLHAQMGDEEG